MFIVLMAQGSKTVAWRQNPEAMYFPRRSHCAMLYALRGQASDLVLCTLVDCNGQASKTPPPSRLASTQTLGNWRKQQAECTIRGNVEGP